MNILPFEKYILFFAGSLILSLITTPIVRKLAISLGQVAVPKDNRWHKKETALLGGVSIFVSVLFIWILASIFTGWSEFGQPYLPLVLCLVAIFLLGLTDDIFDMDPQHKLAGQVIIASILVFFGFHLGWTQSKTINLLLSIIWLVGITNAFNLLDNMDGLSAGIAFIGGCFLSLFLIVNPNAGINVGPILLIVMIFLGSVLGFLFYNFNPASIFMGDAGSLFIGFMLASLTMLGSPPQIKGINFLNLLSVIAIPILILFIPILDTGFVSLMRKVFRRRISQGGRDHSSHRMVAIGFSEKKAVIVLYAFAIVSGIIAISINYLGVGISLVVISLYLLFIFFFWRYLAKVKVYSEKSILSDEKSGIVTPILIEITFRRRLFEVLLDFILITISYYSAYLLRFEGELGGDFEIFLKSLPILYACQILSFFAFGVYKGIWESTDVRDLIGYIKAITVGTIMPMLILLFIYRFSSVSRAVFVIYWGLMVILISISRLSFRLLDEGVKKGNQKGEPTLIYGAGIGGQMTLKEIETNKKLGLTLIGFMDDNSRIHGSKIMGYPVFGDQTKLKEIIHQYNIKKIIISFREEGAKKRKEIKSLFNKMGVEADVRMMRLIIT